MKKNGCGTIILLLLLVAGASIFWGYQKLKNGGSSTFNSDQKVILIPSNTSHEDFNKILEMDSVVTDLEWFNRTAILKKSHLWEPGRYVFQKGVSHNDVINKLRNGEQTPIQLIVPSRRLPEDLAGAISWTLEMDSITVLEQLRSPELAQRFGFNLDQFRTMIIPNTYEVYWNISPKELMERFAREYKRFWNTSRKQKAKNLNLSQSEVCVLASIVKAETSKRDEAPKVAGLYLNRIRKGMALQADPTLIYALGDFDIRRVLDKHKLINDPYNTYLHPGLPPGPINYPEPNYLEAILNEEKHSYLYMCAKPDFSGYHNFAKTYNQHLTNARKYQRALNNKGVYR